MNTLFKKSLIVLAITAFTPAVAGVYGILHDQVSYTISPEYFTRFKFIQFGLEGEVAGRTGAALVGLLATWWTGLPIGLILGLVGLIHKDPPTMLRVVIQSILLTIIVAFITGIVGLLIGEFVLSTPSINWHIPDDVVDQKNFIAVGCMHNFSYLGGLLGMFCGIVYQVRAKIRFGKNNV